MAISGDLKVFSNETSLAYPSANAINGGELNSEENIKNIVTRISTKSYTIRRLPNADDTDGTDVSDETFGLSKSADGTILYIASGECNIRGYYFRCRSQTNINLTDYMNESEFLTNLYNNWDTIVTGSDITLYVYLNVRKDGTGHILSYSAENLTYTNFEGVVVTFTDTPTSTFDLLLGTMNISKNTVSPGFIINSVTSNEDRFTFLDANDIFYYDEDTQTLLNLVSLILKYIKENATGSIHDDITVFGPTISNVDNTTNIYITTTNAEKLFRIFYNATDTTGGLALYSGSLDSDGEVVVGSLIKNLMVFTDLPITPGQVIDTLLTIGVNVTISNNAVIDNNLTVNGVTNLNGNVNIGTVSNTSTISINGSISVLPTSNNSNGTTINDSTIIADKVYGAVWG